MTLVAAGGSKLAPFERLIDSLADSKRGGRTVLGVLAAYDALWTLYGVLAKASQDIHFDMGEALAWSRELALGYPKHPPLSAWVVKAWFTVFPLADWAYYLLGITTATLGLAIAWMLMGRFLDGEKRVAGLALLTLVPFFNIVALKFNANAILVPLWAATTLWFLRSFESRRIGWALLAGVGAAASMLGKYWSIVLLAGLAIAALCDPRRGGYFRSAAPWVTIAAGALLLAPHVGWLVANDFPPFGYAVLSHAAGTASRAVVVAIYFLAATLGYIALPVLITLLVARPRRVAIADTLWPATTERRFAVLAFAVPLLLPAFVAAVAKSEITALWNAPALTLLPVVLLSSPLVVVPRIATVRLTALATAIPALATLAAPAIAVAIHYRGLPHHAGHYRLIAAAIERVWRESTDRPLRLVGSYTNLVNGVIFYLPDRPSTFDILGPDQTPWADEQRISRQGIALVCPLDDAVCLKALEARAARGPLGKRVEVDIDREHWGIAGRPSRYVIVALPPQP
jgi:hypothetical protein